MACKLLPQPLLALPSKTLTLQYPQRNSRFLCATRVNTSASARVVVGSVQRRPSFVVRAAAEGESEGQEVVGNVEEEKPVEASESPEGEVVDDEDVAVKEEKPPRKPRAKLGEIMGILNKRAVEAAENVRPVPDIRSGDVVAIKLEVPENKRRLSVYKGIVISKQNAGIHTTIRIRRIIAGIGVEIVFPLYSPNIKELKVVSSRKVRRARLYYLRDKLPRLSTFK